MNITVLGLAAVVLLTMTVHTGFIARANPRSAGLSRLKIRRRGFAVGASTYNPWQLREEAARG
jgi:hypothetical protein